MPEVVSVIDRLVGGDEETRLRATWRAIIPLIPLIFGQYLGVIVILTLLSPASHNGRSILEATVLAGALVLMIVVSTGVAIVVSRRLDRRSYATYGIALSRTGVRNVIGGFLIGVIAIAAGVSYLLVAGHAELLPTQPSNSASLRMTLVFVGVIGLYLVANVVMEEIVFRGIVLRNLAEGLAARSVSAGSAAIGAIGGSTLVFGVFHRIAPMSGGGIDAILTSAGVGVLLGAAYLLTGNLSFSIGIHLGGLVLIFLSRKPLLGYAVPTVLELKRLAEGPTITYGFLFIRVISGLMLVLGWVYFTHGEVSLDDGVLGEGA